MEEPKSQGLFSLENFQVRACYPGMESSVESSRDGGGELVPGVHFSRKKSSKSLSDG